MVVRLCHSLDTLRKQLDTIAPKRKKPDGWIGDARHRAKGSKSDHNPWIRVGKDDVVTALDVSHDPAGGLDCNVLAEALTTDIRVKYLIFNRRIWNPVKGKTWREHNDDPHTHHLHISVRSTEAKLDDPTAWALPASLTAPVSVRRPEQTHAVLKPGQPAPIVEAALLKELLKNAIDAEEGYSPMLVALVRAFQQTRGLTVDGVVGAETWAALKASK